jgi:glutamate synthase (NADPH/NADH) large chain
MSPASRRKTLVYKGMLLTEQVDEVFPRPEAPAMESALALVHSRFSHEHLPELGPRAPRTATRAQRRDQHPPRQHQLDARPQALFESELFGDDIKKILPDHQPERLSDSAMFDNTLELLVLAGRPLPHAMMMMIPEPWSNHESMDDARRAFYQYHSCLMEPWDGPAAIAFTDGARSAPSSTATACAPRATTSRRTASSSWRPRPACSTSRPRTSSARAASSPGRMFLVDTAQGRIIEDEEIKRRSPRAPYRQWLNEHLVHLERPARGPPRCRARPRHAAAAPDRLRLHLRGRAHPDHPDGPRRRRGHRLHGQRRARSPCSPTSRACSTTTSSSSSPRSRTRRSTRSARRSSPPPRRASAPRATCSTRSPRPAAASS